MSTKEVRIRKYSKSDLSLTHGLVQKTIDISYREEYPVEAIEAFKRYHSRTHVRRDARRGCTLLAESNNVIIGTATLTANYVRRVFVDPAYQGQGIGKLLAQGLEEHAKKNHVTSLKLGSSIGAKTFWESLGYRSEEKSSMPVENGKTLDYYEMHKTLSNDSRNDA